MPPPYPSLSKLSIPNLYIYDMMKRTYSPIIQKPNVINLNCINIFLISNSLQDMIIFSSNSSSIAILVFLFDWLPQFQVLIVYEDDISIPNESWFRVKTEPYYNMVWIDLFWFFEFYGLFVSPNWQSVSIG